MAVVRRAWHDLPRIMGRGRPKRKAAKRAGKSARRPGRAAKRRPSGETALAALAHDIRTPLTGILALAELLAASDLPGGPATARAISIVAPPRRGFSVRETS